MRFCTTIAIAMALTLFRLSVTSAAQSSDTVDAHIAAARQAAGKEYIALFDTVCKPATTARPPAERPNRSSWYREPVKVFDNFYFVGQAEPRLGQRLPLKALSYALWDYSVEDEIAGGLKKLGFDPASIKYVIVSHGHIDHAGGAKYLQDRFGSRIILAEEDWESRAEIPNHGQSQGRCRGTEAHAWRHDTDDVQDTGAYIRHPLNSHSGDGRRKASPRCGSWSSGVSRKAEYFFWFETYSNSARRLREIVEKTSADVLLSNHTIYDGSKVKLPALSKRKPGDPHPYVVGTESVKRYLTVADE